ncbi:hypothetical protein JOE68_001374 [Saccharothrix algeriensis]|uniref:Uncharacterized protein n=1 Tax=Saccharothrix algeriensis TaxID=173560 RepID=A0ABS2S489_9PSEU|nr:hypothetical protein [Saccharothrix algeriensis]
MLGAPFADRYLFKEWSSIIVSVTGHERQSVLAT